jgi:hypothetical protein
MVLRAQVLGALLSGLLGLLTLVWREWLETFGWDPDHGNGSAEWAVALGLLLVAVALGTFAGLRWRHLAPSP